MIDTPPRPLRTRRPDLMLGVADLQLACDPASFAFATTAEVAPPDETVGQERAVEAMEIGLSLRQRGYHVFVAGPSGTGRATAVASLLARLAPELPVPPDRAYVHRFENPERPRLLTLPAGTGRRREAALEEFRKSLILRIPKLMEDRELDRRREAVQHRYTALEETATEELHERLATDGFGLVSVGAGPIVVPEVMPVRDGKPVPMDQLERTMSKQEYGRLKESRERHGTDVRDHFRAMRDRQRQFAAEIRDLVRDAGAALVAEELRAAREAAAGGEAESFLDDVHQNAVATIVDVAEDGPAEMERGTHRFDRFRVNVIADRTGLSGAPVIEEAFPTRQNLAGTVERIQDGPFAWHADAGTIRGGSLVRADGGFLVIQALDLLAEPGAWDQLKRTIKNERLELGGTAGIFGFPRLLDPDPIPMDIKIVLIGERWIYDLLYALDPDFRKLFGVRADFRPDMPRSHAALERYASVLAGVCEHEGLPAVDADAMSALVDSGARLAGRRDRVSLRFSEIANQLREAAYWARQRGSERIGRTDIEEATRRRERREGAISDRIQELLEEGTLLVSTSGAAIGQVNGLSVFDLGYHAFGKPTRITASAAPGRAGIINIEREARLSGGIYDKGVLIISGYLRRFFADLGPLSLTASLAFEQSYAGVDGDSASIAEVVALMSELSGIPVDQGIAITGSINQHGEVQPVGGVNEKIAGFHALCAARGLDGHHGVVLPRRNMPDLMLHPDVVADVASGGFTVFGVDTVEDALEIALDAPIATIEHAVRDRLSEYSRSLAEASGGDLAPTSGAAQPPSTPLPGASGLSRPVSERPLGAGDP